MPNALIIKIVTHYEIHSWEIGARILHPIFSNEKLKPDRASTFGSITSKHGFDISTLEECREHWGITGTLNDNGRKSEMFLGFNWKRKKTIKSEGSVTFTYKTYRGDSFPGRVCLRTHFKKDVDWAGLFTTWCSVMSPFAALLTPR